MPEHRDLSDGEWRMIDPLIPQPERRQDGRGRPWKPRREVLNGILYVLRTGTAWALLPHCYPPYQTCHRRFQQWAQLGVIQKVMQTLGEECSCDKPSESSNMKAEMSSASRLEPTRAA